MTVGEYFINLQNISSICFLTKSSGTYEYEFDILKESYSTQIIIMCDCFNLITKNHNDAIANDDPNLKDLLSL